jgi:hypothetical protein
VQHIQTPEKRKKQSKAYVERETEMEIDYFIKIEKRNVQNIAKTALFPQKIKTKKSQRKTSKHGSLKLRNRYEKHTTN